MSEQIEPLFDLPVFLSPDLPYELPQLGDELGRRFRLPEKRALSELSNYFGNFSRLIEAVALETTEAGELLCSPRFFDLSCELILKEDKKGYALKTCNLGFSTGDALYPEPYLFLNLIPPPGIKLGDLPEPAEGALWQTGEWFGLVLAVNRISKKESKTEQSLMAHHFLQDSLEQIRRI